jgi:hypothetical protein
VTAVPVVFSGGMSSSRLFAGGALERAGFSVSGARPLDVLRNALNSRCVACETASHIVAKKSYVHVYCRVAVASNVASTESAFPYAHLGLARSTCRVARMVGEYSHGWQKRPGLDHQSSLRQTTRIAGETMAETADVDGSERDSPDPALADR